MVLRQLRRNILPRDRLELNQVYTCFRLLVGAPKEIAESGVSANETGDVYACPITADRKDCKRLNLLTSSNFPDIHTSHKFFWPSLFFWFTVFINTIVVVVVVFIFLIVLPIIWNINVFIYLFCCLGIIKFSLTFLSNFSYSNTLILWQLIYILWGFFYKLCKFWTFFRKQIGFYLQKCMERKNFEALYVKTAPNADRTL